MPNTHAYVGPAVLTRVLGDSSIHKFRGRIVRDEATGVYRFYVNRLRRRKFPESWSDTGEWTEAFDLKDVEWLGRKPEVGERREKRTTPAE